MIKKAEYTAKKRGGIVPMICNVLGTLILLSVILTCLPLTIPKYLGYQIYTVVSGSMEPAIPVGSVVYAAPIAPEELQPEDVIAFQSGDSVVTHRVVENHTVEGEVVTKGDANEKEDMNPVTYDAIIGKVQIHIPFVGQLMVLYTSNIGKGYVICFAACGVMLNMIAAQIRARNRGES